jgi:hypothetical protein
VIAYHSPPFSRVRAKSIIGGKSENCARRDVDEDTVKEAEEYGEGEFDDEERLETPRRGGKGRRRRSDDVCEDEQEPEDGIVGGVDWCEYFAS